LPIRVSGRCRLSSISTTLTALLAVPSLPLVAVAGRSRVSSTTLKPLMRWVIFTVIVQSLLPGHERPGVQAVQAESVLAVVAFFEGVEDVGGGVHLAVVLDF